MIWNGRAYIYCTIGPKHHCLYRPFYPWHKEWEIDVRENRSKESLSCYYSQPRNGELVAVCTIREAHICYPYPQSEFFYKESELKGSCVTPEQACVYSLGKDGMCPMLYSLHIENLSECLVSMEDLYHDEGCTKPLTRGPQKYQFAYRKVAEAGFGCGAPVVTEVEKVLVLSVHPEFCRDIMNGIKTREIRKTCPKTIEIVLEERENAKEGKRANDL